MSQRIPVTDSIVGLILIFCGNLLWHLSLPAQVGMGLFYAWMVLLAVYVLLNLLLLWRIFRKRSTAPSRTSHLFAFIPALLTLVAASMLWQAVRLVLLMHETQALVSEVLGR